MSPERSNGSIEDAATTPTLTFPASPSATDSTLAETPSPISLLLAVAESQTDDDLTSLTWLQDKNLLRDHLSANDFIDDCFESPSFDSSNSSISPTPTCASTLQWVNTPQRSKTLPNIPYDPMVHIFIKPPYSFSCLIFMAIEDSPQKALPVKDIYAWIMSHFPYFADASSGWKNSVRHNLSLNKCFRKVEKAPNLGKGSLWTVDPQFRPNLMQALSRSPLHPYSTMESQMPGVAMNGDYNTTLPPQLPIKFDTSSSCFESPPSFNSISDAVNCKYDCQEDVDAATVMLSLKTEHLHTISSPDTKPDIMNDSLYQIITTSPSQDHTYSAASVEIKSEPGLPKNRLCRKIEFTEYDTDEDFDSSDDDEDKKVQEGAKNLLNLAENMSLKRFQPTPPDEEPTCKRVKVNANPTVPFKPRMLRVNKKDGKLNISIIDHKNEEWLRHRRESQRIGARLR